MTTTYLTHFAFRTYTGPTIVDTVGKMLAAVPGGLIVCLGTEHIHYAIFAPDRDTAETLALDWWKRAGVSFIRPRDTELLWTRPHDAARFPVDAA